MAPGACVMWLYPQNAYPGGSFVLDPLPNNIMVVSFEYMCILPYFYIVIFMIV